ncbi:solute carrier family 22 member 3-like isoform X2 [Nylanderia fulva]|uniref:solute carrier family 22 member 3-like isoform X2 n=1 Tax=Nylanderia fulva TaxID=613905 RepID=UPI0010FAE0CB|nr:solute carrier family 22 member 3-like isoform X2 [Nylanderia fulva]
MNAEKVKVGCFQMMLVLLLGINYVIVAMSHALLIFHNYTPKFYCQTTDSSHKTYGCQETANLSIVANSTSTLSKVPVLTACSGEYRFVTEFAESSVVTEWSLICERRYLSFLGPTVYYTGVLLGAWITGFLTDRIGRLPVQAICLYAQGTMAVALYMSYPAFLALRGLQGVFVQGLQNSTYILSMELFPVRFRTLVALIMQIFWSIGLILLAMLNYVIPDWRILQLVVSVPTAITVLYIWVIPESPRWLLAKGKSTEADIAFERITKYNSCCTRSRTEDIFVQEACVKSNTTPIKPERKSRVTSIELKKAKADENQREEATSLLNRSELTEQNVIEITSEANSVNLENRSFNLDLQKKTSSFIKNCDEKNRPSSSKCDQNSRTISQLNDQKEDLHFKDTEVVLRRIKKERMNENEEKTENKKRKNKNSILKIISESLMLRKHSVIMICQWWTSAMACGILDLMPNFPVNRHVTFALGGALEIATYIFVYFVISRYGRRVPMCIYQSFNGAICILIATFLILTTVITPWFDLVKTIMLLFGKVTVTSTISIAYLYTIETFPTVIRGSCLGLCVVFAKLGSLSMPYLLLLEQHVPLSIPLLVIGTLCLIAGLLALILPETLGRILPDRIASMEKIIGDNNCKRNSVNIENDTEKSLTDGQILREKLFSEDWVDAGNGILVNFMENKNIE